VEKDVVLREINMPSSSSATEGVANWEEFESEEEQEAVETVESELGGEESRRQKRRNHQARPGSLRGREENKFSE